jgi:protease-4
MRAGGAPLLWGLFVTGLIATAFFLLVLGLTLLVMGKPDLAESGEKIAIVRIEGVISGELADRTVRQLKKYADDTSIKAIVLRIDSPGGGVASSQEIYQEVKRTRAKGKPIVASMGSLAASGGYYVAAAVERIFANPGTITGSIGVIIQLANAEDLLRKVGVESAVIKSGPFKDSGNPTRSLRDDERQVFQAVVDDVYQQFVEAVVEGRKLQEADVRQYADGRIYSGRQAKQLNLVDELGTLQDAVAYTARLVGIAGKPRLVQEEKDSFWWLKILFDSLSNFPSLQPFLPGDSILQYRWVSPL